ncbi:hypothetical protein GPALN_002252 [Globodera pallida]|nr:hypothetical protein GPALN_002252 [Globodera pallida]
MARFFCASILIAFIISVPIECGSIDGSGLIDPGHNGSGLIDPGRNGNGPIDPRHNGNGPIEPGHNEGGSTGTGNTEKGPNNGNGASSPASAGVANGTHLRQKRGWFAALSIPGVWDTAVGFVDWGRKQGCHGISVAICSTYAFCRPKTGKLADLCCGDNMEMTCTPPEEVPVKPDEVKVPVKPDEAAAITTATQTRRYLDLEPRGCEDHLVVCDDGCCNKVPQEMEEKNACQEGQKKCPCGWAKCIEKNGWMGSECCGAGLDIKCCAANSSVKASTEHCVFPHECPRALRTCVNLDASTTLCSCAYIDAVNCKKVDKAGMSNTRACYIQARALACKWQKCVQIDSDTSYCDCYEFSVDKCPAVGANYALIF